MSTQIARGDRRVLPPTESALAGRGHILLDTDWGAVDVLCEIGDGQDYEWLQTRSDLIERGGRSVRIVSLPALIELKRAANRPQARLPIPILLATLEPRTRDP